MNWSRRNPIFATSLLVLGLVVAGETGWLAERWTASGMARERLDHLMREWRTLSGTQPAPSRENTAAIEADVTRTAQVLAAWRAELVPTSERAERLRNAPLPVRRAEAFFEIATLVETMRARAQRAGVALRPDERFGFSSYARQAPETDQLVAVFREQQMVEYLLEALLEAEPHQLLAVQRPRPVGKPGVGATRSLEGSVERAPGGETGTDYFEMDPRISARVPGLVETNAIRLSFTGHTATLRTLLAKLGEFELPVLVRAVEVRPADRGFESAGSDKTAGAPLVAAAWSRFTVTVEFLTFAPQPVAAS